MTGAEPDPANAPMAETVDGDDIYWVERGNLAQPVFDLDEALRRDRIEFWYQPKIDLKQKKLMGVEAFARFCDADGRVVSAGQLIEHASSESIVSLTERALVSALKTSVNLCEIGVDVRLAINVSVAALRKIPITEIVRTYRPQGGKCLSLVFDISEDQVLNYVDEIAQISGQLRRCGFSVAVDDFGSSVLNALGDRAAWDKKIERTFAAIAKLRNVEFSEMKLDRDLVRGCNIDEQRKQICKHIIGLAHSFGSTAVGVGIEQQDELKALQELECDIGQGYLFGRPMSEERFLMLLWDRGVRGNPKKKPQAA
jgi:EAL domain-containing protein (putative c-di-GMP-specific phosphodiesterase class I)